MNILNSISAAALLSGLTLAAAGPARALPPAESFDSISLVFGQAPATLSAVGPGAADFLNVSGAKGCGGLCTANPTLGFDPSITLQLDQTKVAGALPGNFAFAELAYFIEPTGLPMGTPVNVMLHGSQNFSSQLFGNSIEAAGGEAQVAIFVGQANADPNFSQQRAGVAPYPSLYQDTFCVSFCESSFANFQNPQPIPANVPLVMEAGVPYVVELVDELVANPNISPQGNQLSSTIDPTFTTTTPGVTFSFSPGVTSAVPEPASWAMMIVGLAGVGGALRRARGRRGQPIAAA